MPCLLVVDDEPLNLLLIEQFLGGEHELVTANDGLEAWEALDREPERFGAVILDRVMPRMDGMEVLRRIRADTRFGALPVIMQTAASAPDEVAEGLAAGAWYYLAKPYNGVALKSIVGAALLDRGSRLEQEQLGTGIHDMLAMTHQARFQFRSPAEARRLAAMLARLCPNRDIVVIGLAELLLNAVEHGNLGIGYAEKSQLLAAGAWMDEIERRLATPEQTGRWVEAEFVREADGLRFTVRDRGAGFDWRDYLELDPARAFDSHGRGIALARQLAFASLDYLGCGNAVTVTVVTPQAADSVIK